MLVCGVSEDLNTGGKANRESPIGIVLETMSGRVGILGKSTAPCPWTMVSKTTLSITSLPDCNEKSGVRP